MKNSFILPILAMISALSGGMFALNAEAESSHQKHSNSPVSVAIIIDAEVRVFAEPFGSCAFQDSGAVAYYPGDIFLYQLGVPLDLGPLGNFSPCFITEVSGSATLAGNPSVTFTLQGEAVSAQHFNPIPDLDANADYLSVVVDESGVPRMASTAGSFLQASLTHVDHAGRRTRRGLVPREIKIAFRDSFFAALPGLNRSTVFDDIETMVPTALSPTTAYGALTIRADQAKSVEFNADGAVLFLEGRITGPLTIYPGKGR